MPFIVKCHSCGFVLCDKEPKQILHGGGFRGQNRTSFLEAVARKYGFKCPRCGAKLNSKPVKIEIKPYGGKRRD